MKRNAGYSNSIIGISIQKLLERLGKLRLFSVVASEYNILYL